MTQQTESEIRPLIAVAGPASLDMTIRQVPRGWIGDTGRDVHTPDTLHRLEAPAELGLGGNGGAAAYVLGKLGMNVRLNAPIGDDPAGKMVRGWLQDANVQCIAPPAESTMLAITAVDSRAKRLGCLQHTGQAIDWPLSARGGEANWLLVGIYGQVPIADLPRVQQTLHAFHRPGGTRALDTGVGWIGKAQPPQIHLLWAHVDLLIGTVEELAVWTGCKTAQSIATFALSHGPRQVVIKMGAQGAAYQSHDQPFTHQPACPVSRVDLSIGAGDAFNGALVATLAQGEPLPAAVAIGQQVAAKVVEAGRGVLGWSKAM